jgi:hypothetical protein
MGLEVDPTGRYIASQIFEPASVRFIPPSGKLGPRRQLENEHYGMWTPEGEYAMGLIGSDSYHTLDPVSGKLSLKQGKPNFNFLADPEEVIEYDEKTMEIPGRQRPIRLVTAQISAKWIAVAFDAQYHKGSDRGVFYAINTVNMVRPVIQVSKVAFDEMVAREERAEIMARLNQIGKALMMYAGDNDDTFPTKSELANKAIDPYVLESSILEGFVYHGTTAYGADPASTETGYMLCPGGRAVLYQDGHVVFVPDR